MLKRVFLICNLFFNVDVVVNSVVEACYSVVACVIGSIYMTVVSVVSTDCNGVVSFFVFLS